MFVEKKNEFFFSNLNLFTWIYYLYFLTPYLPCFNVYIPMNTLVCINFLLGKNFIVIGTRYCFVFKACKLMKKEIIVFDEKISHCVRRQVINVANNFPSKCLRTYHLIHS